ncbi:UDP-N-acetylmuramate dehydrogenase [Acidobacteriota bacterium]
MQQSVLLSEYANFRIGGKADYFFCAFSVSELERAVTIAKECSLPYFIMGGGYNLLFDDHGFRGLIIKNSIHGIERTQKDRVQVFSGTALPDFMVYCVENNLGSVEFLAGIPGTVGGAVFGNAGAFDGEIGDHVAGALIFDERGGEQEVDKDYFAFDYRTSLLKTKQDVVLHVTLCLEEREGNKVKASIDEILEKREKKHPPWNIPCAGSFFQNPVLPDGRKVPAAQLLEQVGAKGLAVGNAVVYEDHANFIINRGGATSKEVCQLAAELRKRVKSEFGVALQEEVIFVPADPREL